MVGQPIEANKVSMSDTPYFTHHVFFCMNRRQDGRESCAPLGGEHAQKHAKTRCAELNNHGNGKVRINQAGCLGRCEHGPVLVVYPEGTWYTYVDAADIDDIIDGHLVNGQPVERLRIDC